MPLPLTLSATMAWKIDLLGPLADAAGTQSDHQAPLVFMSVAGFSR